MTRLPLMVFPIEAPVRQAAFDLPATIIEAVAAGGQALQDGDVLAISSKYTAISQGRVINLDTITVTPAALDLAERYHMNPRMAQLVMQEADHIFGGIPGFLLTYKDGILSPNAGIDRSNIPSGYAVLFPDQPYRAAADIRRALRDRLGVTVGIILTDSWLMPGRLGTSGVALATAGFRPIQDERGKHDLFGNPMLVTQRGIADSICVCAQMVMGERDEATPLAIVRHTGVEMSDAELSVEDVAIDWHMCIYVQSLTEGRLDRLPDGGRANGRSTEVVR
ncbi:MAG: coenzyme F420-0:L-glutamate ligase [Chloroflexi bacterium]|nr:coenzyme F420-0:L-glutamate ligase [Chloroflexota bacterium]